MFFLGIVWKFYSRPVCVYVMNINTWMETQLVVTLNLRHTLSLSHALSCY